MNRSRELGWIVACGLAIAGCSVGSPPSLPAVREALLEYAASDRYASDVEHVTGRAERWLDRRAHRVENPAVVLDIDETTLFNWGYLQEHRFHYDPDEFDEWIEAAQAQAAPGALALYRSARERGVTVFFVTGRRERQRAATERNLRAVGFDSWQRLYMKPDDYQEPSAAAFKTEARRSIEAAGYTILANVGDQTSDLVGGFAERTFKLPNPFYEVP